MNEVKNNGGLNETIFLMNKCVEIFHVLCKSFTHDTNILYFSHIYSLENIEIVFLSSLANKEFQMVSGVFSLCQKVCVIYLNGKQYFRNRSSNLKRYLFLFNLENAKI